LPAFLLALTVVAGVLDAVSILRLGGVFVATMTGNLVFLGLAAAGAKAFAAGTSALALAGFVAGVPIGGWPAGLLACTVPGRCEMCWRSSCGLPAWSRCSQS
jgi:hypothetical protein